MASMASIGGHQEATSGSKSPRKRMSSVWLARKNLCHNQRPFRIDALAFYRTQVGQARVGSCPIFRSDESRSQNKRLALDLDAVGRQDTGFFSFRRPEKTQ